MFTRLLRYKHYRKVVFSTALACLLFFGIALIGLLSVSMKVTAREAGAAMVNAKDQYTEWLNQLFLDSLNIGAIVTEDKDFVNYMKLEASEPLVEHDLLSMLKKAVNPYPNIRYVGVINGKIDKYVGTRGVYYDTSEYNDKSFFPENKLIYAYIRTVKSYENLAESSREEVLTILYRPHNSNRTEGRWSGIVLDIRLSDIRKKLQLFSGQDGREAFIMDSSGSIVMDINAIHVEMPLGDVQRSDANIPHVQRLSDGNRYIFVWSPLNYANWEILCIQSFHGLNWRFMDLQGMMIRILLTMLIAYIGVALLLSKVVYNPVQSIMERLGIQMGQGEGDEYQQIVNIYDAQRQRLEAYDKRNWDESNDIRDMLLGKTDMEERRIDESHQQAGEYYLMLYSVDRDGSDADILQEPDLCLRILRQVTEDLLKARHCLFVVMNREESIDVSLIIPAANITREYLEVFAIESQDALRTQLRLSVSISIAHSCVQWKELHRAYSAAHRALFGRIIHGPGKLFDTRKTYPASNYPTAQARNLFSRIKLSDLPAATDEFDAFLKAIHTQEGYQIIFHCTRLLGNILEKGTDGSKGAGISQEFALCAYHALYYAQSTVEVRDALARALEAAIECAESAPSQRYTSNHQAAGDAKKYIENNYTNSDLTLSMIAEEVHLSTAYLGQIFTRTYGKGANEYITELRMTRAANLLETTNLTIQEISAKVGIQNQNYFYRLFKNYHGMTPTQYREEHKRDLKNEGML